MASKHKTQSGLFKKLLPSWIIREEFQSLRAEGYQYTISKSVQVRSFAGSFSSSWAEFDTSFGNLGPLGLSGCGRVGHCSIHYCQERKIHMLSWCFSWLPKLKESHASSLKASPFWLPLRSLGVDVHRSHVSRALPHNKWGNIILRGPHLTRGEVFFGSGAPAFAFLQSKNQFFTCHSSFWPMFYLLMIPSHFIAETHHPGTAASLGAPGGNYIKL